MKNKKEIKRLLRTWFIKERQSLSIPNRKKFSQKIFRHVSSSSLFKKSKTVAIFLGFGSEVDTSALIQKAWGEGKTVLIPMTDYGLHKSYFAVFRKGDRLLKTDRGPLELVQSRKPYPMASIDLVIVPGLAFDQFGARLGYGGGVYDRLLKKTLRAHSMGLYFSVQELASVPREKHDFLLDCIVTEKGFLSLAKRPN